MERGFSSNAQLKYLPRFHIARTLHTWQCVHLTLTTLVETFVCMQIETKPMEKRPFEYREQTRVDCASTTHVDAGSDTISRCPVTI